MFTYSCTITPASTRRIVQIIMKSRDKSPDYSIVVPVYNSSESLRELVAEIESSLDINSFEIIFVDDNSSDDSWDVIGEFVRDKSNVSGVKLSRNYGQHNALLCGIRLANGKYIITMDDDLQHQPSDIHHLKEELDKGFDVVYGAPNNQVHSLGRVIASKVTKWVLEKAMGADTASNVSAFRIFRRSVFESLKDYSNPNVNLDIMLTWVTSSFSVLKINHRSRKYGETGYSLKKLLKHAMNMVTGFSTLPLQLASLLGLAFSVFGFFVLIYILLTFVLYGQVVQGFYFISSLIAIFSGVQLLTIGIMGEYLARIHTRSISKPVYSIRETLTARNNGE